MDTTHKRSGTGQRFECNVSSTTGSISSDSLESVDCADCLRFVAVRATANNVELEAKYEHACHDRERYWSQLLAARALSEQRRYALHYVIYPDEGRTVHPTTGRLQELAEPDAE